MNVIARAHSSNIHFRNIYSKEKQHSYNYLTHLYMLGISIVFIFHWVGTSSVVQFRYSSSLTKNSQTYSRKCDSSNYYYESIEVNVVTDGWYTFSSNGITDPAGYIYKDNFNPFYPRENLLSEDDSISYSNFQLITHLQANTTYVLVVTTHRSREIGAFLIFVLGPNNVSLNRISEYLDIILILFQIYLNYL
jgi:hypothetical protein